MMTNVYAENVPQIPEHGIEYVWSTMIQLVLMTVINFNKISLFVINKFLKN